jgi:NhaA family Na+:H+ antiporter
VVGIVAGIGFTMALFVAQLAFPPGSQSPGALLHAEALLETSKLAIITGSIVAALLSVVAGRFLLSPRSVPGEASTEAEAEASTTT